VDPEEVFACIEKMTDAYQCLDDAADAFWEEDEPYNFGDLGAVEVLNQCGWSGQTPLDRVVQWVFVDYEYAEHDPSLVNFPSPIEEFFLVHDQRGFEYLPQRFAQDHLLCSDATRGRDAQCNGAQDNIRLNQRVTDIKYDLVNAGGVGRRVKVRAQSGGTSAFPSQQCTEYTGKRVIATVSAGVLNEDLIEFDPPLKYPAATSNPMKMQQYIKIFYQFPTVFWDNNNEFIVSLKVRINRTEGFVVSFKIAAHISTTSGHNAS